MQTNQQNQTLSRDARERIARQIAENTGLPVEFGGVVVGGAR
jgi:hypothetical protein